MKTSLRCLLLGLIAALLLGTNAFSEENWLPEFEEICSMTEHSEYLSRDELKALVTRCEKLRPIIEQSENPQKKVYIFRLDKCKNLFLYVLEVTEPK